ncbi:GNAT family N-acetyltransferase [Streptomyces sp. NPDC090025]|uniref:GNAT family N-acetyltransferase n=1 Tax=Streptomyces sp. NPDC090025 TaxID=3365922 RepID=UPI0038325288
MEIRRTTAQDHDLFIDTLHTAFGLVRETPDADGGGVWWAALEPDRGLLAFPDGGDAGGEGPEARPVGTAAAYTFELTLPGEVVVPTSGVTGVGVLPSHRRRGVLTALMRHQLAELRERGEFLSVLLASEAVIYRRFGYGPATYSSRLTVPRNRSAFAPEATGGARADAPGSIEVLRRAECGDLLQQVYDRHRRAQPGALSRPERWWRRGAGRPPVASTPRYVAVHRDADGEPDGYASYSIGKSFKTLTVDEVIALDDTVFTALARFALDHDLISEVVFQHMPPDHPLRWRFADFRAAEPGGITDELWVRLLDVPRALTTRGWRGDGELVLAVDDPFLGEGGRYLLTVRDGKAECVTTDRSPDLTLDICDLGSVYLGGTRPSTLVRAGRVRARDADAVTTADALFTTDRAPHSVHWF